MIEVTLEVVLMVMVVVVVMVLLMVVMIVLVVIGMIVVVVMVLVSGYLRVGLCPEAGLRMSLLSKVAALLETSGTPSLQPPLLLLRPQGSISTSQGTSDGRDVEFGLFQTGKSR